MEKKLKKIVEKIGLSKPYLETKVENEKIYLPPKPYWKEEIEGIVLSMYYSAHFLFSERGHVLCFLLRGEKDLEILLGKEKVIFSSLQKRIRMKIEIKHIIIVFEERREMYHISGLLCSIHPE